MGQIRKKHLLENLAWRVSGPAHETYYEFFTYLISRQHTIKGAGRCKNNWLARMRYHMDHSFTRESTVINKFYWI